MREITTSEEDMLRTEKWSYSNTYVSRPKSSREGVCWARERQRG